MVTTTQPHPKCKRHPAFTAAFGCLHCGAHLCPRCAASRKAGYTDYLECGLCGGPAETLLVPRSVEPYARRILSAPRYPLNRSGLLAIGAAGLVLWLLKLFISLIGWFVGFVLLWSYVFSVIRQTAVGKDEVEPPDVVSGFELVSSFLRALAVMAVVFGPAGLFAMYASGPAFVSGLLVALGAVLAPMSLIVAASGAPLLQALSPIHLVAYIRRIRGDYAIAFAASVVLVGAIGIIAFLTGWLSRLPIPLTSLLAECISVYPALVAGRVLGLLLFVHGGALGLGSPEDGFQPVLPGARPEGTPAQRPAAAAPSELGSLSEIDPFEERVPPPPAPAPPKPRTVALDASGKRLTVAPKAGGERGSESVDVLPKKLRRPGGTSA